MSTEAYKLFWDALDTVPGGWPLLDFIDLLDEIYYHKITKGECP